MAKAEWEYLMRIKTRQELIAEVERLADIIWDEAMVMPEGWRKWKKDELARTVAELRRKAQDRMIEMMYSRPSELVRRLGLS